MHAIGNMAQAVSLTVSLDPVSVTPGEPILISLAVQSECVYDQIQIEIFSAGVANPVNVLGFGVAPDRVGGRQLTTNIDTESLKVGVYEVALVRLHSPREECENPQVDLMSRRDFSRQLFEVRPKAVGPKSSDELLSSVQTLEREIEDRFLQPLDVRQDQTSATDEFTVLVFVRDILVSLRMRFDHFEIVPTNSGLDAEDAVRFVNEFLLNRTTIGLEFSHDDSARQQARQSTPVAVIHFPSLVAVDAKEAVSYAVAEANVLLLALSLSRDAGGIVFDTVTLSKKTGEAVKFSVPSPYVGNILTGGLAGENFESVRHYAKGISLSEMNRFLVGLYRDARRERTRDFQYVRFWQLLETMAEAQNYDPGEVLRDFDGKPMTTESVPRRLSGSVAIVFNFLRENQLGNTIDTWKNVNVWFAFRNAVAHHGAITRYAELSRESVKEWARLGLEELEASPGHDHFLWSLKEDVKLLLMRRLVRTASA